MFCFFFFFFYIARYSRLYILLLYTHQRKLTFSLRKPRDFTLPQSNIVLVVFCFFSPRCHFNVLWTQMHKAKLDLLLWLPYYSIFYFILHRIQSWLTLAKSEGCDSKYNMCAIYLRVVFTISILFWANKIFSTKLTENMCK